MQVHSSHLPLICRYFHDKKTADNHYQPFFLFVYLLIYSLVTSEISSDVDFSNLIAMNFDVGVNVLSP